MARRTLEAVIQAQRRPQATPLCSWGDCQACPKLGKGTRHLHQPLDEGAQEQAVTWGEAGFFQLKPSSKKADS